VQVSAICSEAFNQYAIAKPVFNGTSESPPVRDTFMPLGPELLGGRLDGGLPRNAAEEGMSSRATAVDARRRPEARPHEVEGG
jgi:hypothetical protein